MKTKNVFEALFCLHNEKIRFKAFVIYSKWKNTFLNLFHFTKWRSIFLKRFISFKMNMRFRASNYKQDKIRFWNVFHVWKIKKNVFEALFIFTKCTNIFLKRFHFYKMKGHILVELVETHGCEAVDVFTNQTSAILNCFSFIQVKLHDFEVFSFLPNKMHFLEVFFINFVPGYQKLFKVFKVAQYWILSK